ncbi:hypothetical protein [Streptomyces atratus]|uniref:hypothetical protein n=1 Tax=Streptomyces atratus TaxID=1893 RepID=UPI0018E5A1C8|nr:hypothetical protein [Streptomyces atratus]
MRRTRGGRTATKYHTARFILVPALREELEELVPDDRGPGGRESRARPSKPPRRRDDDVTESPGNRGEGRRDRLRGSEVDREVPGTGLHWRRRAAARPHTPGVRHRRPEVLVVGEAL